MVKTPLRPTCRVIFFGNFHIVAHGPAELRTDAKSQERKYGISVVPGVSKSGLKVKESETTWSTCHFTVTVFHFPAVPTN